MMPPDLVEQVPLDLLGLSNADPIEHYLDALALLEGVAARLARTAH